MKQPLREGMKQMSAMLAGHSTSGLKLHGFQKRVAKSLGQRATNVQRSAKRLVLGCVDSPPVAMKVV